MTLLPSARAVQVAAGLAAACAIALMAGVPLGAGVLLFGGLAACGVLYALVDLGFSLRAWRRHQLQLQRRLPPALALGVPRALQLTLNNPGPLRWQVEVFDHPDASVQLQGLPLQASVGPGQQAALSYEATPTQRGQVSWQSAAVRVRSRGGAWDLGLRLGPQQSLRVLPNFAAVSRYAWLAGDRRLSEIGIKTYTQRGSGTDFKELTDYTPGDPVRHIDWRATLRQGRPIVRQFQDERDQRVLFVLDCGRRMRADDDAGSSHFDQALNALMLLAYVALKEGDEVGALTFGTPPGGQRHFAPRKGAATLAALTARLHDLQASPRHSDYLAMATEVMRLQPKRALVVVLTNFRDEDTDELQPALKLLRSRHLVLLASLRETVLRALAEQPLQAEGAAVAAAGAHLFEQARRDAFKRLAARDALLVDTEPAQLAPALVNRYHAIKRAGLL